MNRPNISAPRSAILGLSRFGLCAFVFLVSLGRLCAVQPDMRPALLGSDARSLINRINADSLMKRGQTDAMVMFTCAVTASGNSYGMITYHGTPNSQALSEETISRSENAAFIPAVYHHASRDSVIFGTVFFFIDHGKPHLRIFLNQETEHLAQKDDFIAPQPVFIPGSKFRGFDHPQRGIGCSGSTTVRVTVDATGKLEGAKIVLDSPPGKGFGEEVMSKIGDCTFLPGYLNGKPVACSTTFPVTFRSAGKGSQWNSD
jgi:TonB family protein